MDSPLPFTIRSATRDDRAGLLSLLEAIMHHHGVPAPDEKRLDGLLERVAASPDHDFLVAVIGRRVIGMCGLIYTLSTWSAAPVCEVQDVIVVESHRRAGVGSALLAAAEAAARTRGCARLYLRAESENLDAHRFYRSVRMREKATLHFERSLEPPMSDGHAADPTTSS